MAPNSMRSSSQGQAPMTLPLNADGSDCPLYMPSAIFAKPSKAVVHHNVRTPGPSPSYHPASYSHMTTPSYHPTLSPLGNKNSGPDCPFYVPSTRFAEASKAVVHHNVRSPGPSPSYHPASYSHMTTPSYHPTLSPPVDENYGQDYPLYVPSATFAEDQYGLNLIPYSPPSAESRTKTPRLPLTTAEASKAVVHHNVRSRGPSPSYHPALYSHMTTPSYHPALSHLVDENSLSYHPASCSHMTTPSYHPTLEPLALADKNGGSEKEKFLNKSLMVKDVEIDYKRSPSYHPASYSYTKSPSYHLASYSHMSTPSYYPTSPTEAEADNISGPSYHPTHYPYNRPRDASVYESPESVPTRESWDQETTGREQS